MQVSQSRQPFVLRRCWRSVLQRCLLCKEEQMPGVAATFGVEALRPSSQQVLLKVYNYFLKATSSSN